MKVGFIGLGVMGLPMAKNIARKYQVIGYNRSEIKEKVSFEIANSAKEVVEKSEVIITMVNNDESIKEIYSQIEFDLNERHIWIDMSTASIEGSKAMAEKVRSRNARYIEAPVVKSQAAAINGELGIYVGGEKALFESIYDILSCMGKEIFYMGDEGAGLWMKFLHNVLVGHIQNGVNELFAIAKDQGLDLSDVTKAVNAGGAQNGYISARGVNIIKDEYKTAFSVKNMHKDLHIAKAIYTNENYCFKSINHLVDIYDAALENGFGDDDFSITYKVVENKLKK